MRFSAPARILRRMCLRDPSRFSDSRSRSGCVNPIGGWDVYWGMTPWNLRMVRRDFKMRDLRYDPQWVNAREAVARYQKLGYVHPLTCRFCPEREDVLRPELRGGGIVMVCPVCLGEQPLEEEFVDLLVQMSTMDNPLEQWFRDSTPETEGA